MSLQASAYGRLDGAPRAIETKSGKPMAVASIAVDVGDDEGPPLWLGVVAFGKLADLLLRHAKGDLLSASGRMQVRRWPCAWRWRLARSWACSSRSAPSSCKHW